ncbi:NAD(P)H-dependent oxidoreductase [Pollutibacter soli]|uniref:NADPH-dependent FMN reductase n=1 Tax=Pollutibacter soli TaxID=3034157 RepID=UPI0030141B9C
MYKLIVIICSTREGRKGPIVADWFIPLAKANKHFIVEVIDLKEVNLPFMDEPNHPRLKKYTKKHTWDWSRIIDEADAFIMVLPEYNYGYPATIKNAIDYLHQEWLYKPVGFVSYGGIAAGTRSIQALKQVLTALQMVPLMESVNIPFFTKYINADNHFVATEEQNHAAQNLLFSLEKWTETLAPMRKARLHPEHK